MGTVASLAGDRTIVTIDRISLPVSSLATLARDAHLARTGAASTAERLKSEVRCDTIATFVRAHTALCDAACVIAACEAPLEEWSRRFNDALVSATSTLRTATLSFVGPARAPWGW